jgi:hypothetical protein
MATWTDYDTEREAELALAELTGSRLPEKRRRQKRNETF